LSFFFHHPATPQISTLSLHDALPIYIRVVQALLNNETTLLFYAFPDGNKYTQMMLVVDTHGYLDGEETALRSADGQHGGVWYSRDRKSTRLNSSHVAISYAVFCLKKK